VPDVTIAPAMSSRYLAAAAIIARAESLTDDGGWPSAQLIDASALAFVDAMRDHFQNDMFGSSSERRFASTQQDARTLLRENARPVTAGGGDHLEMQISLLPAGP
jgi:hypothetical protein